MDTVEEARDRLAELLVAMTQAVGGIGAAELRAITAEPSALINLVATRAMSAVPAEIAARHQAAEDETDALNAPLVEWTAGQLTAARAARAHRSEVQDPAERRRRAALRGIRAEPFPDEKDEPMEPSR